MWLYEVFKRQVEIYVGNKTIKLQVVRNYIHPKKTIPTDPLQILKDEKNRWPQHFIYSKTDDLIQYQVSGVTSRRINSCRLWLTNDS